MRFITYPNASSASGSAQPTDPPAPKWPNERGSAELDERSSAA